jgi:deferrochelatase/peroxidase EfeB
MDRRTFLKGAAVGAIGTAVAGATGGLIVLNGEPAPHTAAPTAKPGPVTYPFHGPNQAGILTPGPAAKQAACCFAAFDVLTAGKADLADLLKTITARSRYLTAGIDPSAHDFPSSDDVLGTPGPPDGLTVTLSVGASLFDDRYGLRSQAPLHLTAMPAFPDDTPDPAWLHGDLLLQLCADHPDTVHHALRDIAKRTRGEMQLRWKIEGYASPPRPSGTPRNLMGFKDGTANPTGDEASGLVWVDDPAEPAWALGGSYQVVRLIRMLVEFWDRIGLVEQQRLFGRDRETGAPLDGSAEFDTPNYAADPTGVYTPLDSHIRLANPRTADTANQRVVRRSYNYDLGVDLNGNMQAGHIFTCYQQNVARQFAQIQARLAGEPLVDYVQPFGGGYFFVLPGVRNENDWLGRQLLA